MAATGLLISTISCLEQWPNTMVTHSFARMAGANKWNISNLLSFFSVNLNLWCSLHFHLTVVILTFSSCLAFILIHPWIFPSREVWSRIYITWLDFRYQTREKSTPPCNHPAVLMPSKCMVYIFGNSTFQLFQITDEERVGDVAKFAGEVINCLWFSLKWQGITAKRQFSKIWKCTYFFFQSERMHTEMTENRNCFVRSFLKVCTSICMFPADA